MPPPTAPDGSKWVRGTTMPSEKAPGIPQGTQLNLAGSWDGRQGPASPEVHGVATPPTVGVVPPRPVCNDGLHPMSLPSLPWRLHPTQLPRSYKMIQLGHNTTGSGANTIRVHPFPHQEPARQDPIHRPRCLCHRVPSGSSSSGTRGAGGAGRVSSGLCLPGPRDGVSVTGTPQTGRAHVPSGLQRRPASSQSTATQVARGRRCPLASSALMLLLGPC